MCLSVRVCVRGSGTAARSRDHFQPAGDLTRICFMLMGAVGLAAQTAAFPPPPPFTPLSAHTMTISIFSNVIADITVNRGGLKSNQTRWM